MAFEVILPQVTTVRSGPEEVSLALYGKEDTYSVSIKLGQKVLHDLGWSHGDRVVIAEGTGSDAGLMELRKVPRGGYGIAVHNYVKDRPKTEFDGVIKCMSRKFVRYEMPSEPRSQVAVPYEVVEGNLRFVVPDWMLPVNPKDMGAYNKNRTKGLGGQTPTPSTHTPKPRNRGQTPKRADGRDLTADELINAVI